MGDSIREINNIGDYHYCVGRIMYFCQCIEHDIKLIYKGMRKSISNKELINMEKWTLGKTLNELESLDNSDGKPYFPKNDMYHVVQNEEYLYALVDAENKQLIGIRHDGEIIEGKIPLKTRQEIEHVKTELSRNVLAVEMDRATGRIIGYTGNDSRIKSCVQDRVTGKITINQIIE